MTSVHRQHGVHLLPVNTEQEALAQIVLQHRRQYMQAERPGNETIPRAEARKGTTGSQRSQLNYTFLPQDTFTPTHGE